MFFTDFGVPIIGHIVYGKEDIKVGKFQIDTLQLPTTMLLALFVSVDALNLPGIRQVTAARGKKNNSITFCRGILTL